MIDCRGAIHRAQRERFKENLMRDTAIHIVKGSTYLDRLRWATETFVFVQATIVPGAPLLLDAPGHEVPDDWRVKIEGAREIDPGEWFQVRRVGAEILEVNRVNATHFKPHPVTLRYHTPVDLAGYSARMQIRESEGGRVLLELTSEAPEGQPRIVIDNAGKTIAREIPAAITATLRGSRGVYDMEMVSGDYVVKIGSGTVFVQGEVTR
jgi:hypothetical protein